MRPDELKFAEIADRLFLKAVGPLIPHLRDQAAEESSEDGRTRARARLALQAISERIQRAAARDIATHEAES